MQRNDGGNFSSDRLAQILGNKYGSLSEDELEKYEAIPQEAVNASSGMIGSVNSVGKGIKLVPSEFDLEQEALKKMYEKAPSLWQKYGPKDVTGPGGEVIPIDRFKQITDLFKK